MRNSDKHGVTGAGNAKNIPFRYVGGTPESPRLFGETALARQVNAAHPWDMAHYQRGMIAGIMAARLGFSFQGDKELETKLSGE